MSGWLSRLFDTSAVPQDYTAPANQLGPLARQVMANPVGTEQVGQQSLTNQRGGFDPLVDPGASHWPGQRPMLTQSQYDATRNASLDLFNQAALVAGSPAAEEGAAVGVLGRRPAPMEPASQPAPVVRAPEAPQTQAAAPAPPAPGMIRYYHGTLADDASTFTGKTFVTPNQQYARDYHGNDNNVLYFDVSKDEAIRRGLYDDLNDYPVTGSINDGARLLKPLPDGHTPEASPPPADAPQPPGFTAYHGSPHDFDAFDTSKIGTGEGAQAYGHGLYFAENEGVARGYRDKLALQGDARFIDTPAGRVTQDADMQDLTPHERALLLTANSGGDPALALHTAQQFAKNPYSGDLWPDVIDHLRKSPDAYSGTQWQMPGHMYEVNVNADPAHFLDWDKPLSEQSAQVQQALRDNPRVAEAIKYSDNPDNPTGQQIHNAMVSIAARKGGNGDVIVGESLRDAGIPGIRYLDAGSRGAGSGTRNAVVFDPATLEIIRKYGIAGLLGGTGAVAGTQQPSQ